VEARGCDSPGLPGEARFEPRSYGFRPGRGCHDAVEATFNALCRKDAKRVWILDADLAAAFDRIDHSRLLDALGDFPARGMVTEWLKAGVFESDKGFTPTEEGTPQGGVISPLLLNVALHGLEEAAGVRYHTGRKSGESVPGSPVVIRYADDMIAFRHSQVQADQVKARLAEWLKPRSLAFNEDKTKIRHLTQGFEFLGFHIRRYPNGKLLIKPSPKAVKRVKRRLTDEMRCLRGSNVNAVLARLIPIVRGWAAYYRSVVSSRVFSSLDHHLWQLVYKWASWTHANKPKPWVVARYFDKFNKFRNDR
jgi:RNA-directed DNA polymerase